MAIEQFNAKKIISNFSIPKTKIIMSSLVATILITGMIFMSSPQVFANPQDSVVMIGFDNSNPNAGEMVTMTGTVTTLFTVHNGMGDDHEVIPQEDIDDGKGRIVQGFDGDIPASACEDVTQYSDPLPGEENPVSDGEWTTEFYTTGLGGQTLVFRAQFVNEGSGIATGMSDCLELVIVEVGDPFDGFKTWTHTDYNWDPVCDGFVNGTGFCVVSDVDNSEIGFRPANINNNGQEDPQDPPNLLPDDDVLADSLDISVLDDNISDVLVQVKRNGEISNMIPGAIYALTTVNILTDIDMLQVDELYADCTDNELELLNQNKLSRNVKVSVADPNGDVTEITDKLYDESDTDVEFVGPVTNDLASVKINDSGLLTNGSTVFVLVKFDDQLKGQNSNVLPEICMNTEDVTSTIDPDDMFLLTFEAMLRMTEAQ